MCYTASDLIYATRTLLKEQLQRIKSAVYVDDIKKYNLLQLRFFVNHKATKTIIDLLIN